MESALLLVQVSPSVDADETTDEEGSLLRRRTGGDASLGPMALWSDRKVDRVWIFVEQKVKSSTWGMTMVTTHFAFVDVDVVIRYLLNLACNHFRVTLRMPLATTLSSQPTISHA
jgi:hypothetical protein